MVRLVILAALAACGSKPEPAAGPALTPGVTWALRGIAPDCTLVRRDGAEERTCRGRPGTLAIRLDAATQRLRAIEIRLVSMTLPQAQAHLQPALLPLLGQAGIDELATRLATLATGDRASLAIAGAAIDLVAGGTSKIAPEYAVDLRW